MEEQLFLSALQYESPSLIWLFSAFLLGILTSLTPCIYPIIPITVATLGQQSKYSVKIRTVLYCVGFAVVYSALGAIAALTGQMFGAIASNPIVMITFANLLLLFAFILKGWIPVPARLQSFGGQSNNSAFTMGALSALVAAPCSSPVLAAILLFVAEQQSPLWGTSLLFCFSLGMCLLLFVAGIFSGYLSKLPRSGKWMSTIQWLMFLLLLLMAQYYLIKAGQLIYF